MSIENLTTQEKSVLLAKAMGWTVETMPTGNYGKRGESYRAYWIKPNGDEKADDVVGYSEKEAIEAQVTEFYRVQNFNEAWRVLGWASDTAADGLDPETANNWINQIDYLLMDRWRNSTAEEVQAEWLDKVLELSIEAGLIAP